MYEITKNLRTSIELKVSIQLKALGEKKKKEREEREECDQDEYYERIFDRKLIQIVGSLMNVIDYKIINDADAYRISEISIFFAKYICGIEVKYRVSSKK